MLTGHCLCGRVRYEADAEIRTIIHCHCETCRRTHAAAFSSIAAIPRKRFRWTAGEELLSSYESSPGKFRRFCSVCGSHLFAERTASEHLMLRLGCLDTPIKPQSASHIWRSDCASWYDPKDVLPEYPEGNVTPARS
ncbi:MAG TPA: GFA family protein [Rhizomicrobium sp.]|nr:GFA family protein [Rhizomicrobium sp.]